jgi:glycosyltransferase involved in cell wall biosynthesis
VRQSVGSEIQVATVGCDGAARIGISVPDTPSATIRAIFHERNRGKGAALRTGFRAAPGDVLVIQNADLENAADPRAGAAATS